MLAVNLHINLDNTVMTVETVEASVAEAVVEVIEEASKAVIKTNNQMLLSKLPSARILNKETASTAINAHLLMEIMN